jgi:hypothetical protein
MTQLKRRWYGLRSRSKTAGTDCCIFDTFAAWYESQPKSCAYCGIEEEFLSLYCTAHKGASTLHIDRIDNNLGYTEDNMRLACHICNSTIKWTRSESFINVVVSAILENGMLDQYHLWTVPVELREEACFWHQFTQGETIDYGDRKVYRYQTPNTLHYLPDRSRSATEERDISDR